MIQVKGLTEFIGMMQDLEINIPYALGEAGSYAMRKNVEPVAKERCAVDSGLLRGSIHTEITNQTQTGVTVQTGTNVFYAPFIEYGTGIYAVEGNGRKTPWRYFYRGHKGKAGMRMTRGGKPQPFLVPAFEMNANRLPDDIAMKLQEMIKEASLKRLNRVK